MKQDEINRAFEGRWRYVTANSNPVAWVKGVKELCLDFFRSGVLLSNGSVGDNAAITVITDDFQAWWNLYDKKIDRAKCWKKWAKMTSEERRACIAATPAYVASTPDIQYRRHPMTYLNNKSWENQIIPHNGTDNKPTLEQQRFHKLADILTGE